MDFQKISRILDGIPYTSSDKGRLFYDLVLKHRPSRILELGFAHGVSTCYFAAALEEVGGQIDAVDLDVEVTPSLEELSRKCGVSDIVNIFREKSSYTWFLKKQIEIASQSGEIQPKYDMCFIDGPKDWTNDGLAFFLVDKLLNTDGLIIFDDYSWTYRKQGREKGYVFERMSEEEFIVPQIEAVFRLLVMQHPLYSNFEIIDDSIAIAQKKSLGDRVLAYKSRLSLAYRMKKFVKRVLAKGKKSWAS